MKTLVTLSAVCCLVVGVDASAETGRALSPTVLAVLAEPDQVAGSWTAESMEMGPSLYLRGQITLRTSEQENLQRMLLTPDWWQDEACRAEAPGAVYEFSRGDQTVVVSVSEAGDHIRIEGPDGVVAECRPEVPGAFSAFASRVFGPGDGC